MYCTDVQQRQNLQRKSRFFILPYDWYYFIYHIDVYQVKDGSKIDIHPLLHNLFTTQKSNDIAIINNRTANDSRGSRQLSLENRYSDPQLFSLMESNYNLREVRTCRATRKVLDAEKLMSDKKMNIGKVNYWLKKILAWL